MKYLHLMFLISLGAIGSAGGPEIVGRAQAVDSDALDINGKRVLLHGADGPERGQICEMNGRAWACWQVAVRELETLVSLGTVTCRETGEVDVFNRPYAVCHVGNVDLAQAMVRSGMAMAVTTQTTAYTAAEEEAKAKKLGLWRGAFMPPWEYRDLFR